VREACSGKVVFVEACEPFDAARLLSGDTNFVNNMLLRQVDFPAGRLNPGDDIHVLSTNHAIGEERFNAAGAKHLAVDFDALESSQQYLRLTDAAFVAWAKEAAGFNGDVAGARLIRHVDSTGQPVYEINLYIASRNHPLPTLYSGNLAPNVRPRDRAKVRVTSRDRMLTLGKSAHDWDILE
jgi:hypothetical protein